MAGGLVSTNYFEVIGADAMLGRTWRRYFRGDPQAIGSAIQVRTGSANRRLTVIGVMPEGMEPLVSALDFYTPIVLSPNSRLGLAVLIGRLGDGVSVSLLQSACRWA